MIVWGGSNETAVLNTGGRYDPSTDTWASMSTGANVPAARYAHTAVWTGTEMIVWGGATFSAYFNSGARYDPSTDAWTPTSTGANVPAARYVHTAVWTGSRMIVWGGESTAPSGFNTGGRYDPALDTWAPTSTGANVPAARGFHSAVWTGSQMIVWGGNNGTSLATGGRYDPSTDAWTATSTAAGTPSARTSPSAVWTGDDMIVWGGEDASRSNTGGRYAPATNTWTATSIGAGVPSARVYHVAAWTGKQMIVWGGLPATATGGVYCACPNGEIVYRDADGDGYGDPGGSLASCDGSIASGYVADRADCDDASAAVHPGATETCNGIDDDCNLAVDDGIPAPTDVPEVSARKIGSTQELPFNAIPGLTFDVVTGSLPDLRASGGDFSTSTTACLANDLDGTSVDITATADGSWYLVRAVSSCGGAGSYDEGVGSQQGSRDTEIAASGRACP
jgi:N-acetylneuraminic acid mutarotase